MIGILDKIVAVAIYGTVFVLPFSKAGIEIFGTTAIVAWILRKGLRIKGEGLRIKGARIKDAIRKVSFFPESPFNRPIGVLFVISFISMFFSVNLGLSLEGVFLKLVEYVLLFFVCYDFFSQKEERDRRTRILITIIMISALLIFTDAIFQWITGTDFLRGYVARGRLRASFTSANNLSAWLIVIIPLLWGILFMRFNKDTFTRSIKIIALILSFTGVILLGMTFSRGAWVGFFIGSCFIGSLFFMSKEKSMRRFSSSVGICLVVLLVVGIFIFKPVQKRLLTLCEGFEKAGFKEYVWQEAIAIIEDFPVLGTGPNTYAFIGPHYKLLEHTGYYPHNSYLHMAAETGLLGLGAFLWIVGRFFYMGIKKVKESGDILLLGIMGGLCAFLVHSFFNPNLFALQLVVLIWVMLGIGTARIVHGEKLEAES